MFHVRALAGKVNKCGHLLQKDVVGWGFPRIAMDWQVIGGHLSVYYICKLLSGSKMLLVQICLVSADIDPQVDSKGQI